MEWIAGMVAIIGVAGVIIWIGLILLIVGIFAGMLEPLIGGIVLAIGVVLFVGGLLYAVPAYFNGDQVDLYERAYLDYSTRWGEVADHSETADDLATNLGVERLYATCVAVGSGVEDVSIQREHSPNVHDMELLGVSCDTIGSYHGSAGEQLGDAPLNDLSRRAGIEGVTAAVNGQRSGTAPIIIGEAPEPTPELSWWQKRTTRKRPLRKVAEELQSETIELDTELKRLTTINTLLADEYADLRQANIALKLELAAGTPSDASVSKVLLLLKRPPLSNQLQVPGVGG